ncbi:hypothetical protein [Flavitalea sp.]|nr:hypothetical protein [Flavitalea sp.]
MNPLKTASVIDKKVETLALEKPKKFRFLDPSRPIVPPKKLTKKEKAAAEQQEIKEWSEILRAKWERRDAINAKKWIEKIKNDAAITIKEAEAVLPQPLREEIKAEFEKINEKLDQLLNRQKGKIFYKASFKETWVSAQFIIDLTGWNGQRLSQARKQRIITYRAHNDQRGYEYLVESLSEKFILKVIAKPDAPPKS